MIGISRPFGSSTASRLHVAGVGASAGGLEAMLQLFAQIRPNGRLTYVVAQHMAKDGHDELVVRLMNRESNLPVLLGSEGVSLQADTVYVIPSGKDGTVTGATLTLHEPAPDNISTPSVNTLFSSIAESGHRHAIGILLSGTGTDGVAGCRALKAHGGLTIAQDPAEAKFDGMPSAAIHARLVDQVLNVAAIANFVADRYPGAVAVPTPKSSAATSLTASVAAPNATPLATPLASSPESRELVQLIGLVHQATGIDFSSYKEETLLRRLDKRKATLGMATAEQYLALIRRQPEELHTLQHLFLVSVSSFFRDHGSFAELERSLAAALAVKPAGEPLRVWVPGCASGEEPYTLAILLNELLDKVSAQGGQRNPVSIIGTDLNPEALAMARAGVYRQTGLREMSDVLRERYFVSKGQHCEVSPLLRELVQFEQRDVLTGTPKSLAGNLDLVSCRNLLIYMKSHLQDQLITSFHRALLPQGLLFIGQSESLGLVGNSLFTPIDHYHRLFRRRH